MVQCNCDAKNPVWAEDHGVITDKETLPITKFELRKLKYELQQAKIQVSSLKCTGMYYRINSTTLS